jgi:polyisoprenoid-binding protein YceI
MPGRKRHWLRWLIGGLAVIVIAAVGGPFVFIHFIEGSTPAPFKLRPSASASTGGQQAATSADAGSLAGTWIIRSGSQAGYRVQEVLFGQQHTAVGRTSQVTGHLTITGTSVTAATFSVPMSTVHSDASQRDAQFDGRIMDTATYPTGTFTLTSPISLDPVPATGQVKNYTAHGNLTLRGATRPVTFTLSAERTASGIEVSGSIPVLFATWNIPNPSFAGVVTTQNHGLLEFLLTLRKS